MKIVSTIKNYEVVFGDNLDFSEDYFIIDQKVYDLHKAMFDSIDKNKIYLVTANESEKSYRRCAYHIENLILLGLKRGQTVGAIGGGVIQDLAGFITSITYRGISWNFYPTTLLSQCDSCIGGKTSINLGDFKNTVGNFNPPNNIFLSHVFLKTLTSEEVQSGLGEILKVMIVDKKNRINDNNFIECVKRSSIDDKILNNALIIKKEIIEVDEFDKGVRNIMNYGHTFGHAIESITNFRVPHGIAVGIGIYIANNISIELKTIKEDFAFNGKESVEFFIRNNHNHVTTFLKAFKIDEYLKSLSRDKKNTGKHNLTCILLDKEGSPYKTQISNVELKKMLDANIRKWFQDVISN